MMMFDIIDVYGKLHYFFPQTIVTIDETLLKIKDDLGRDDTINCFAMTFINDVVIYISESTRSQFMSADNAGEESAVDDTQETEEIEIIESKE